MVVANWGLGVNWLEANWLRIILAVTSTGTLGIALRFYTVWRNGRSSDAKLEQDGDGAIREHFAKELQSLRDQLARSGEGHAKRATEAEERHRAAMVAADDRFNRAMDASDEREAACQREVRLLREEVRKLSEEILGLRKNMGHASRAAIVLAAQVPSLDIQTAADRAADALTESDERLHALPHSEGTPNQ